MTFTWASAFNPSTRTYANIITEVQERIDQETLSTETANALFNFAKQAVKNLAIACRINFDTCIDTLVTGTTSYTLPTNLGEVFLIQVINNSNQTSTLLPSNEEDINRNILNYCRSGNTLLVNNAAHAGTIKIYGQHLPDFAPASSSAVIDIPELFMEAIINYIELQHWKRERRFEELNVCKSLLDESKVMIKDYIDKLMPTGEFYG